MSRDEKTTVEIAALLLDLEVALRQLELRQAKPTSAEALAST